MEEMMVEEPWDGIASLHKHSRSRSIAGDNGIEELNMDSFLEALQRPTLDMEHFEDRFMTNKQPPTTQVHNSIKQEEKECINLEAGYLIRCARLKYVRSELCLWRMLKFSSHHLQILQLEKKLKSQVAVRYSLEQALGYKTSFHEFPADLLMPKPATELIKEISVMEVEVVHLEQYLLSLYRKAFDHQVFTLSPPSRDEKSTSALSTPRARSLQFSKSNITQKTETPTAQAASPSLSKSRKEPDSLGYDENLAATVVQRCQSSLSQYPDLEPKTPHGETLGKAPRSCYSQPLSMMEYAQNTSTDVISLAEHLGTRISDHIPDTPNKISEDMIKCMAAVYYKLAEPPTMNHSLSSPSSPLSSVGAFSPKDQCDVWGPGFRQDSSSFDGRLDNRFHVEGLKEFSGPYSTMVEVPCIYRDNQRLGDVEDMLMSFRSLVARLEQVDPRKMKHEEKLAFWINIHNALVMHAFLAYGTPKNNMKKAFLLLKAAYNVGGHVVSADTIQSSILGCRMSRPGQWLRLLISSKSKFKDGDKRQAYSINHPQPLLHFALCSGNHSDPAVRVYTPKRVFQELETAKEEYVRATFGIRKDKKLLLPKVVESFAKESGLCQYGLTEMIQQCLPDAGRKSLKKCLSAKSRKSISWIPYNFTFRYIISKELVK